MRENTELRHTELHTLEERYFERMAGSLGDKARLLEYLPKVTETKVPRVLDVGAGGGEFANELSKLGYDVTALDASDDAIMRMRSNFPLLTTAKFLANHADELGEGSFDVVICSSILHEVFSYGDDIHNAGHISSIGRAFEAFERLLVRGGVLLIRDGVLPDNWDDEGTVTLGREGKAEDVKAYLDMCPFANGVAYGRQGTLVRLTEVEAGIYSGNLRSLMEFAYTYTWGVDSFPRETQELYGVMTLSQYSAYLEINGFKVETAYSYLQPGYATHLVNKLALDINGVIDDWPASNAIWVARKP